MRTSMFWKTPQVKVGTSLPRRSTWKHSEVIDAQQQHNLCFYPGSAQFDMWPEITILSMKYISETCFEVFFPFFFKRQQHMIPPYSLNPTFSNDRWKKKKGFNNKLCGLEQTHDTYITSIVINGEVSRWQLWLAEAFMTFKCLVKLLWKCLMRWPWKHTTKNKEDKLLVKERRDYSFDI